MPILATCGSVGQIAAFPQRPHCGYHVVMCCARQYLISTCRSSWRLLPLACLLWPAACRELRETTHFKPADGKTLPILRQVTGTHSHEAQAMQVVVRDPATLSRIPLEDVAVDFSTEMLLIVTLGRVTSDQHAVMIERVWREGHRLRVALVLISPAANAPVVLASPYCIAVVPRCDLNVADFDPEPPRRTRSWRQSPTPSGW